MVVSKPEFQKLQAEINAAFEQVVALINGLEERVAAIEAKKPAARKASSSKASSGSGDSAEK